MIEFQAFDKIARFKREVIVTEKIDGTNACVAVFELNTPELYEFAKADPYCIDVFSGEAPGDSPMAMYAGSRSRWIAPEGWSNLPKGCDNFAFAQFVLRNAVELRKLGPGRHYGEWYGLGVQRGYGLTDRRFALFNTARWGAHNPNTPACCEVVPVIPGTPDEAMYRLAEGGSVAVPGFRMPEGVVIYHTASRQLYKQTFEKDGGKWQS